MTRGKDERHNPKRRPMIDWRASTGQSSDYSGFGSMLAEMLKQQVYDATFNDIVGIPNDVVGTPNEGTDNG